MTEELRAIADEIWEIGKTIADRSMRDRLKGLSSRLHTAISGDSTKKFCIIHPSDRVLCLIAGNEAWNGEPDDAQPVLFDTQAEAQKHIDERVKQFPNGDWPDVSVGWFTPGKRVYADWSWVSR